MLDETSLSNEVIVVKGGRSKPAPPRRDSSLTPEMRGDATRGTNGVARGDAAHGANGEVRQAAQAGLAYEVARSAEKTHSGQARDGRAQTVEQGDVIVETSMEDPPIFIRSVRPDDSPTHLNASHVVVSSAPVFFFLPLLSS